MASEVRNIEIEKLKIHPKNVRKEYTGIEELAESIKAKGVLQNLTVVPDPDEAGTYFVVIGNRRLEAAKMAGVETLPCAVAEMDEKEQAESMLLENMLRENLSIYEEAQGFQMVLDLGESEKELSEKTGFSRTTVRRRLNIAKLDQEVLQEKEADEEFQLSLSDLYELEKVKDVEKRNEILENARDSRDITFRVRRIINEEKQKKNIEKYIALFEQAGITEAPEKVKGEIYSAKWETALAFQFDDEPDEEDVANRLAQEIKEKDIAYYRMNYYQMIVMRKVKKEKREKTPEEKKRAERDSRKKKSKVIEKDMRRMREDFVRDIIAGNIKPLKAAEEEKASLMLWYVIREGGAFVRTVNFMGFLKGKEGYGLSEDEKQDAREKVEKLSVIEQELIAACGAVESMEVMDWQANYNEQPARILKALYEALSMYGYSLSNDEAKLLDGTHDLYTAAEIEEA